MKPRLVVFIFCQLFMISIFSQNDSNTSSQCPHFYVYLKNNSTKTQKVEFGDFTLQKRGLKKINKTSDYQLFIHKIKTEYQALPADKKSILFYIHGFWADNAYFVKHSGHTLQTHIFNAKENPCGMVISLQWNGGLSYPKGYAIAKEKGKWFAQFMKDLQQELDQDSLNTSFLCHSMGNRVFENMYLALKRDHISFPINKLFMLAADLETTVFNDTLKELSAKEIYVSYHAKDKTLKKADLLKAYPRLGIYGLEPPYAHNIKLINFTEFMNDNEDFVSKYTLHRYYYSSPAFRKILLDHLSN